MHDLSSISRQTLHNGYILVKFPHHPRAWKTGWMYLHRLVAENFLGRFLRDDELVHHRNRVRTDNRQENLEILTASGHAAHHARRVPKMLRPCQGCRKLIATTRETQKYCSKICRDFIEMKRPKFVTKKWLTREVWKVPTTVLAKRLKVSDAAIAKWCKHWGISKPPRGYWAKKAAGVGVEPTEPHGVRSKV